ncbi:hypothetical protein FKW77_008674 [Venturia effusa]|uniref:Uncharacterized protein n=1 Tax=Venturia effusa TaxID=50376 RepID=A0A517KX24_9PEZI|nr:hypothetical protein FKW77_008674 [Venturia effusa]
MYTQHILLAILAALSVSAIPLNINLGAYSPALVVGDGEISFGGNPERASEVLQTLASGAATGAVPGQPAAAAPLAPAAGGITSPIVTPAAPIVAAQQRPDVNSNAPAILTEGSATGQPAEFISHAITGTKYPNMVKRSIEIEGRDVGPDARVSAIKEKFRRDLAGFREALSFARDAQKNEPKVELGFGITKNAGVSVPVESAANGQRPTGRAATLQKREAEAEPEKLGMTLIAISEI